MSCTKLQCIELFSTFVSFCKFSGFSNLPKSSSFFQNKHQLHVQRRDFFRQKYTVISLPLAKAGELRFKRFVRHVGIPEFDFEELLNIVFPVTPYFAFQYTPDAAETRGSARLKFQFLFYFYFFWDQVLSRGSGFFWGGGHSDLKSKKRGNWAFFTKMSKLVGKIVHQRFHMIQQYLNSENMAKIIENC